MLARFPFVRRLLYCFTPPILKTLNVVTPRSETTRGVNRLTRPLFSTCLVDPSVVTNVAEMMLFIDRLLLSSREHDDRFAGLPCCAYSRPRSRTQFFFVCERRRDQDVTRRDDLLVSLERIVAGRMRRDYNAGILPDERRRLCISAYGRAVMKRVRFQPQHEPGELFTLCFGHSVP